MRFGLTWVVAVLAAGCSGGSGAAPDGGAPADAGLVVVHDDPSDTPLTQSTSAEVVAFHKGDQIFANVFRPADGLGPMYIRTSCESCHSAAGRGPGLVQKMAVLDASGAVVPSALPWGVTLRPFFIDSAPGPLGPPTDLPPGDTLRVSTRVGPSVLGRGYMEAIAESELVRVEQEQAGRADGIHGRINRVTFHSHANSATDPKFDAFSLGQTGVVGRFGLKARVATLDDFAADAFQGDMGLTSPMRPDEPVNPYGLTDDDKPGVDLTLEDEINPVATYMRFLEIPARDVSKATPQARALFGQALCATCHVPSLHTRADYPVARLADIDAPVFSDLLLHDMGDLLADDVFDESAKGSEWRTAPLIGMRLQHAFMHDARASSVTEAILAHQGPRSQANPAVAAFQALSDGDRALLVAYVESL
jgi:CxxC motif-containing protein (DUF1111 family)